MSENIPPTKAFVERELSYTESRCGNHEIDEIAALPSDGAVSIYGMKDGELVGFHIRVNEEAMQRFCRRFLEDRGWQVEGPAFNCAECGWLGTTPDRNSSGEPICPECIRPVVEV
jgi:hypothetical protein